jgi:hypothetical protein
VLTRPGFVGAACRPPQHLPDQAAPSSLAPAASKAKAKVSHLHSTHSASWRTPFFTNSTLPTVEADIVHRRHAIIETVFADLIDGPLAHLPSGHFGANSAWVLCAAIAHNLLHTAGILASGPDTAGATPGAAAESHARARGATLRRQLITVPARLARPARAPVLHLPSRWPWAPAWLRLWNHTTGHSPPVAA